MPDIGPSVRRLYKFAQVSRMACKFFGLVKPYLPQVFSLPAVQMNL
jgi:hypothetical protein